MSGGGSPNVGSVMAHRGQQLAVEVEMPNRHQIDDADRHTFLEQRRTLGDKDIAMLGSILVRRTDDLNGRDQAPPPFGIEDSDLVFVVIG